jgi:hypothetical protein
MLLVPARRDSKWKVLGPFGSGRSGGKTVAEVRAEMAAKGEETHSG